MVRRLRSALRGFELTDLDPLYATPLAVLQPTVLKEAEDVIRSGSER